MTSALIWGLKFVFAGVKAARLMRLEAIIADAVRGFAPVLAVRVLRALTVAGRALGLRALTVAGRALLLSALTVAGPVVAGIGIALNITGLMNVGGCPVIIGFLLVVEAVFIARIMAGLAVMRVAGTGWPTLVFVAGRVAGCAKWATAAG